MPDKTTSGPSWATDQAHAAVEGLFAQWDQPGSPGAALAVTRGGEVVYERGYGLANLEYDLPITGETVFHVASVSKQFTAYAVLILAGEGRLTLDDDVRAHLPDLPDLGAPITLRHLIHHTSGLRDQWQLLRWAGWRSDDVITQEHLLKMIRRQKALNFPPGGEFLYSNSGYTLLAEVVAAVSGQSFRDFTTQQIFRPLGMSKSFFYTDHEEIVRDRAYSYQPAGAGEFKKGVLSFANAGATSLFTTARDLGRWLAYLDGIEGGELAGAMQAPFVLAGGEAIEMAAGLVVKPHRGLRTVGHAGADAGYRSYCGRYPEHGLGVVILCNLGTMDPSRLAQKVAEAYLGPQMAPATPPPQARPPAELGMDLDDYAGEYILSRMGRRLVISAEGGAAQARLGEDREEELQPVAADRFYLPGLETSLAFAREPGAKARAGTFVTPGGVVQPLKRVLPAPAAAAAQAYTGDYYSAELDTVYRVRLSPAGLTVQHQRLPDQALHHTGPDEFAGVGQGAAEFRFQRDAAGDVSGFTLNATRCRDLAFFRRSAKI